MKTNARAKWYILNFEIFFSNFEKEEKKKRQKKATTVGTALMWYSDEQ